MMSGRCRILRMVRRWPVAVGTGRFVYGMCPRSAEGRARRPYGFCLLGVVSPDGQTLASGSADNTVRLWDVSTGQQKAVLKGHTDDVSSVSFSWDGQTLASGSYDYTVRLWDVSTGQQKAVLEGHTSRVLSVSFSWDGQTLASGGWWGGTVRLWDMSSGRGKDRHPRPCGVCPSGVVFSDGQTLASGSRDAIWLWDVSTGGKRPCSKAIRILSSRCRILWMVRRWPVAVGTGRFVLGCVHRSAEAVLEGHTDFVWSVSYSPDGQTLASGSGDNTIRLWDVSTGQQKGRARRPYGCCHSVSFSWMVRRWLVAVMTTRFVCGMCPPVSRRPVLEGHTDFVLSVSYLRMVSRWQWQCGTTRFVCGMCPPVSRRPCSKAIVVCQSVSFSWDGQTLASGSYDNTVRLWDVSTGQQKPCSKAIRMLSIRCPFLGMVRRWPVAVGAARFCCGTCRRTSPLGERRLIPTAKRR